MANKWKAGNYMNSGLSKSQYLAKQSKPKAKSTPQAKAKILVGEGPLAPGQTRASSTVLGQGPLLPGQTRVENSYTGGSSSKSSSSKSSDKSSSSSSKKTVDTSQRTLADTARKVAGINTAEASGANIVVPTTSKATNKLGSIFQKAVSPLEGIFHSFGKGMPDLNLSESLGLTKQIPGGLAYNTGDQPGETLDAQGNVVTVNPSSPESPYYSNVDFYTGQPKQAPAPYNSYESYQEATKSPSQSQPTRKSQPVSNPWVNPYQQVTPTQAPQTSLKSSYSPQATPNYENTRTNERTMRGMGGQGIFSTGQFSNGSGDYGFQGTMGTEGGDSEQDWLNKLLGINTAEAAGFDEYNPYTQMDRGLQSSMNNITAPAVRNSDLMTQAYQAPQANYRGGAMGGAQVKVGGNQQANESGEDYSYNAQMKLQEKSYKEQQKAQEKALKELIKSITGQYDQSETETRGALGKQNQEDMLRLSGLFNFANQDPNSEQRMQYEQRAQNDYQTQLANAMTKLGTARAGDISGAKQNYQNQIATLSDRRAQAIQAIQQDQRQYQQRMQEMQMKAQPKARATSTPKKQAALYAPDGSYTFNERDPESGLKIFYDENNQPFINA